MEENKITVEITEGEKLILDFSKKLMTKLNVSNEKELIIAMISWVTSVTDSLGKVSEIIEKVENASKKAEEATAKIEEVAKAQEDEKVATEDLPDFLK